MAKPKLNKNLVEIRKPKIWSGKWKFGSRSVRGTVYEYPVIDWNFKRFKKWIFQVRVPKALRKGDYIEVRPVRHPERACWAGIERTSINFTRCTKAPYKSSAYAKVTLADTAGEKTKVGVGWGERSSLPKWMKGFRFRLKKTVTTTKGTDEWSQVVVVSPDNLEKMIRFFLVSKAWVLHKGFALEDL